MKKTMQFISKIMVLIFGLSLVIQVLRTGVFLTRITSEVNNFRSNHFLVPVFMPHIQPCEPYNHQLTEEELHLLLYRSLGTRCQN